MSITSLDKLMIARFAMLFDYEYSALFEALRRDMRNEKHLSFYDKKDKDYHLANCRASLRLLEALNPKRTGAASQTHEFYCDFLERKHEPQQEFSVSTELGVSKIAQFYWLACRSSTTLNDAIGFEIGTEVKK